MGRFSKGSDRGGSRGRSGGFRERSGGFGGRSEGGFRGRDSGRPMKKYDATCSQCGKECQLPFRPTGKKPVLCSDCFRQSGNARDSPRGLRPQSGFSSDQIKQINAKLDKILSILQESETTVDTDEGDVKSEDPAE
jgi:CxxC-x17-CxxC domain-containing protein